MVSDKKGLHRQPAKTFDFIYIMHTPAGKRNLVAPGILHQQVDVL
jgi:hypothetical protein